MTTTVYVCTMAGRKGKWSRYTYPFSIDAFAQLGNALYIRAGDSIVRVSEDATTDTYGGESIAFDGTVQWGWLDFGQSGVTKQLEGFDVVASGSPSIAVGYDQRDTAAFTDAYAIDPDTLPGGIIPFPVAAPTMSVRLTFTGAPWSLSEVLLYLDDARATT